MDLQGWDVITASNVTAVNAVLARSMANLLPSFSFSNESFAIAFNGQFGLWTIQPGGSANRINLPRPPSHGGRGRGLGGELYGRHLMGVNMSMSDFFDRLERLTGGPAPRLHLPSRVNVMGAKWLERWAKFRGTKPSLDPQEVDAGEHYFYLDTSKAERELGFRARDPQETLYDTVQYIFTKMPPADLPGTKGRLAEKREGT